jgi:hypothetical protein
MIEFDTSPHRASIYFADEYYLGLGCAALVTELASQTDTRADGATNNCTDSDTNKDVHDNTPR